MNLPSAKHPSIKVIAVFLAMLLLLVQFTAAFHHHHTSIKSKQDGSSELATSKFSATCSICHYIVHHSPYGLNNTFLWLAITGNLLITIIKLCLHKTIKGFWLIPLNKGPPVSLA